MIEDHLTTKDYQFFEERLNYLKNQSVLIRTKLLYINNCLFYLMLFQGMNLNNYNKENFVVIQDCHLFSVDTVMPSFDENLINYLHINKITKINLLILSTYTWDRITGILDLLKEFSIDTLVIPYYLQNNLKIMEEANLLEYSLLVQFQQDPIEYFVKSHHVKEIIVCLSSLQKNPFAKKVKRHFVFSGCSTEMKSTPRNIYTKDDVKIYELENPVLSIFHHTWKISCCQQVQDIFRSRNLLSYMTQGTRCSKKDCFPFVHDRHVNDYITQCSLVTYYQCIEPRDFVSYSKYEEFFKLPSDGVLINNNYSIEDKLIRKFLYHCEKKKKAICVYLPLYHFENVYLQFFENYSLYFNPIFKHENTIEKLEYYIKQKENLFYRNKETMQLQCFVIDNGE